MTKKYNTVAVADALLFALVGLNRVGLVYVNEDSEVRPSFFFVCQPLPRILPNYDLEIWYNASMADLPQSVRASLWSYDPDKMDLARDKERIILQVLNHGTDEAVRWLFDTYSRSDITATVQHSDQSEWGKKSLNFWSVVLGHPSSISRGERIMQA